VFLNNQRYVRNSFKHNHLIQNQHVFSSSHLYVLTMYGYHQADHKQENRYTVMLGLRFWHLTYVLCEIYRHLKFSSHGNTDGVKIYIYIYIFFGKFAKR